MRNTPEAEEFGLYIRFKSDRLRLAAAISRDIRLVLVSGFEAIGKVLSSAKGMTLSVFLLWFW